MKFNILIISLSCSILYCFLISCSSEKKKAETELNNNYVSSSTVTIANLLPEDDWRAPDTATITNDRSGEMIKYGRELISNTGKYFGPHGIINHNENGMSCQNCHLNAGTKLYANSFSAVFSNYPKFRPRSGTLENLYKRINDCMERSLNGRKIDTLSREMQAMVAYINWVGKDVKKGITPQGASVVDLPFLNRAADPEKGKIVFEKNCITCHGNNGEGKLNDDSITYLYPPLWGSHSYNNAAGLFRLSRLAGFIKYNMPNLKSSFETPVLSDEEAWDVAAHISNMPRPVKKFRGDWPDISKKPVDLPFGPYTDSFSENQHKFGPFSAIKDFYKKNK